jgi:hypothetical protein
MAARITTKNPEILKDKIIETQSLLRRLKAELRLIEAERRDRERLQKEQQQEGARG